MNKLLRIVVCAGLLLLTPPVFGGIPPTINYQGYLTSGLGVPVNVGVPMVFRLYSAPTGATLLWTESRASVTVTNGNFNVALGSVTPLDLNFDVPYWLTVEIGTDGEMSPRQALSSVPYAVIASELDSGAQVAGSQIVGTISMANIAGSQITGAIGTATIGGSQVTGAITTATIGGSQITGNIAAAGDIVAAGNLFLPNSTASVGRIRFGSSPFIHNYGTVNTFVGEDAGNFTQTGSGNASLGAQSMQGATTGFNNTAAGIQALRANTSGFQNSAFGSLTLLSNVDGSNNTALGSDALKSNVSGGGNTAAGRAALFSNVAGSNNAAFGFNALYNAIGSGNVAIGVNAGSLVTSGSNIACNRIA